MRSPRWEVTQDQIRRIRSILRDAARQDWDKMDKDLRPIYTAVDAERAAGGSRSWRRSGCGAPGRALRRVLGAGSVSDSTPCGDKGL